VGRAASRIFKGEYVIPRPAGPKRNGDIEESR
jgi:hypothetical protein